jgi:hypothetical protein
VQFRAGGSVEAPRVQTEGPALGPLIAKARADKPLPMAPVTVQSAREAYAAVLAGAGATLPRRDPVDARVIGEVRSGRVTCEAGQGILTDVKQVGGYPGYKGDPALDRDGDGIPDWWEIKYGLNPRDPSDATKDCNGDGYSNVEKYLNGIDPTRRLDFKDPKNNVSTLTRARLSAPAAR